MANQSKKKPPGFRKNFGDLMEEQVSEVVREAASQIGGREAMSVTKLPPKPNREEDGYQPKPIVVEGKDDEEQLKQLRARLAILEKEAFQAKEKIVEERGEIARKRNPVVEGIDSSEKEGSKRKEVLPSPPQTISKPKRGLPPAIGQPEKRQRR